MKGFELKNGLTVISGRPAIGKTTFALNVVLDYLRDGKRCIIVSMVHPKEELIIKLACIDAKISFTDYFYNEISEEDKNKYKLSYEWLIKSKLEVYDGHMTFDDIARYVWYEENGYTFKKNKPDLVYVDSVENAITTRIKESPEYLSVIADSFPMLVSCSTRRYSEECLKDKSYKKYAVDVYYLDQPFRHFNEKEIMHINGSDMYNIIIKTKKGKKEYRLFTTEGCRFRFVFKGRIKNAKIKNWI